MNPAEYRAQFDATVTFSNGGGLTTEGFRIDVPGEDVSDEEIAALFVSSLNLLMVDRVRLPVHRSTRPAGGLRVLLRPRLRLGS
jgi:hypothetical protein